MNKSAKIKSTLEQKLRGKGSISFSEYMATVLYDPRWGYYANGPKIGKRGDYYTSVSVGSCFGLLLSLQIEEIWERMDRSTSFVVVEQGANDAQLAHDVLEALRERNSPLFSCLQYQIVEPLEVLRQQQREKLAGFTNRVQIVNSCDEVGVIEGVFFSNELVDAFPVFRVVFEEEWKELRVVSNGEDFEMKPFAVENEVLGNFLADLGSDFPPGYTTEVNLNAGPWTRTLSEKLERGVILAIDYGYLRDDYYRVDRKEGTLRTFYQHQAGDNPFAHPGESDLTAHVDFTTLINAARESGLEMLGLVDQNRFLVGVGEAWLLDAEKRGGLAPAILRQFQTLTHPTMMGRSFQVFGAARGVSPVPPLSGFRYGNALEKNGQ